MQSNVQPHQCIKWMWYHNDGICLKFLYNLLYYGLCRL